MALLNMAVANSYKFSEFDILLFCMHKLFGVSYFLEIVVFRSSKGCLDKVCV